MKNMQYEIFTKSLATPEQEALLEHYYALRKKAFTAAWGKSAYTEEASEYDLRDDTVFVLMLKHKKVCAGLRLATSAHDNIPLEMDAEQWKINNVLPHLDKSKLRYVEMGGLVVDPEHKGKNLSFHLCRKGCETAKNIRIENKPIDFIISTSNEMIIKNTIRAALESGYTTMARPDTAKNDLLLKSKPMIVIRAQKPDFPFLSESMKKRGVGVSGEDFLKNLKHTPPKGLKR